MTVDVESWRAIPGFEGAYEASSLGRVRSLDRLTSHNHRRPGVILRPAVMPRGYLVVNLWWANRKQQWLVHRLLLTAFVGAPEPDDAEARHLDGDPANNRLSNLSWGTHSENQFDQVQHGTHAHASKTHCPQGHPYDDANAYIYPGKPHRGCRACRSRWANSYSRRKAA